MISCAVIIKSPKFRLFSGILKKQKISIISRCDTERLSRERNISQVLKDGIKMANIAGMIDSNKNGNNEKSMVCVLFQTPNEGFTYAAGAVKNFL